MKDVELFPLKSEQPESKDLKSIISKYLKYWYLFIIGGMVGLGGAYLYFRYYTPIPQYLISSTILLKGQNDDYSASALGDLGAMKSYKNINNEIEVLSSVTLMQRAVNELNMSVSYFIEGRVKDVEIYGKDVPINIIINQLNPSAFGKSVTIHIKSHNEFELEEDPDILSLHKFGKQVNRTYGNFTVTTSTELPYSNLPIGKKVKVVFHDMYGLAQYYNQVLSVMPKREDASVLRISLVDPIPEKGIKIVNKLIEVYNRESIEDKNQISANTVSFLDERIKFITTELTEVEKDVERYKRENELTDVSAQASQYLAQASDYNNRLSEWAIQIDILESIEEYLNSSQNQYKIVPSTLIIQDPTLSGLIAKFNDLQQERERILRNAFPNNPLVLNINEQLEDLRANINENLRNIKRGLIITSRNLKSNSGQYQSKISKVPIMERELLEINRQQTIKQNLYLYLLQKREEAALSSAANLSNSKVIDPAIAIGFPAKPRKQTIYVMSIFLGFAAAFAGIFVKEFFNDKVQSRNDIEQMTATPILGEVSNSNSSDSLVVVSGNRSPIVEMIRLIRTKLCFAAVDRKNKTILITSCKSGEGKTFFSINLGASLALAGKKVILLELDLRKPQLSKNLGLTQASRLGITDFLVSDNTKIEDIIQPVDKQDGLYIIGSGPMPPDPAELMMSQKLAYLINELKENFDHIIIDTAPVGLVSDAFCLGSLIDSTVFVVRANYTVKSQIKFIDDVYRNKELSRPMIVLNDVKKNQVSYYGNGYDYTPNSADNKKTVIG